MGAPIVHFEIMGGEGKQTEEFYRELFDWKIASDNEFNYGVVDTESGAGIAGGVGPAGEGPQRVTVYAQVPDINAKLEDVKKLGGKVVLERSELPMVTIAMFEDPSGNITGLIEG